MQFLCDDNFLSKNTNILGEITLVNCTPHDDYHIHEFGYINSYTESHNQEMGVVSKITLIMIDDLLNPISTLTDLIIEKDFPIINK